ncbi:MAG: GYF domain-containing protein [Pseudomonadota bacterium]
MNTLTMKKQIQAFFVISILGFLMLSTQFAGAQSRSTSVIDGVEYTVIGGQSQSISATDTGAEIVVNGRTIIVDGTKVSLGSTSVDFGKLETLEIEVDGNTILVFIDGTRAITSTQSASSDSDEGERLDRLGVKYFQGNGVDADHAKAIEYFKQAADLGHTNAANNLVIIFWNGTGQITQDRMAAIPYAEIGEKGDHTLSLFVLGYAHLEPLIDNPDPAAGIVYYERAAAVGSASALVNLGVQYRIGKHVKQDHVKGTDYFRQAAEKGDTTGMNNYAWALYDGNGVAKNVREALKYAKMAIEEGYRDSHFLAGVIYYFENDELEIDYPKALFHFTSAAELGHTTSAFNLGIMYRDGQGMEKPNLHEAIRWMTVAMERGHEKAGPEIQKLRESIANAVPDIPQEKIYWYAKDQQKIGPLTLGELREAFKKGEFSANSYVWKEGLPDWIRASQMDELS